MGASVVPGALQTKSIRTEVFPKIDPHTISFTVACPGANREDVANGVSSRIESAIAGLSGVKRVVSGTAEEISTVTAELTKNVKPDTVAPDN